MGLVPNTLAIALPFVAFLYGVTRPALPLFVRKRQGWDSVGVL